MFFSFSLMNKGESGNDAVIGNKGDKIMSMCSSWEAESLRTISWQSTLFVINVWCLFQKNRPVGLLDQLERHDLWSSKNLHCWEQCYWEYHIYWNLKYGNTDWRENSELSVECKLCHDFWKSHVDEIGGHKYKYSPKIAWKLAVTKKQNT